MVCAPDVWGAEVVLGPGADRPRAARSRRPMRRGRPGPGGGRRRRTRTRGCRRRARGGSRSVRRSRRAGAPRSRSRRRDPRYRRRHHRRHRWHSPAHPRRGWDGDARLADRVVPHSRSMAGIASVRRRPRCWRCRGGSLAAVFRPWSHSILPTAARIAQSTPVLCCGSLVEREVGSGDVCDRARATRGTARRSSRRPTRRSRGPATRRSGQARSAPRLPAFGSGTRPARRALRRALPSGIQPTTWNAPPRRARRRVTGYDARPSLIVATRGRRGRATSSRT